MTRPEVQGAVVAILGPGRRQARAQRLSQRRGERRLTGYRRREGRCEADRRLSGRERRRGRRDSPETGKPGRELAGGSVWLLSGSLCQEGRHGIRQGGAVWPQGFAQRLGSVRLWSLRASGTAWAWPQPLLPRRVGTTGPEPLDARNDWPSLSFVSVFPSVEWGLGSLTLLGLLDSVSQTSASFLFLGGVWGAGGGLFAESVELLPKSRS